MTLGFINRTQVIRQLLAKVLVMWCVVIFLEELKDFWDWMLRKVCLVGVYPLWMKDSMNLLRQSHTLGFSSIICAADASKLDKSWLGSLLTKAVMQEDVDPCGENGQYHSFVTSGPLLKKDIDVQIGAV